jgi:hypothetical protein
MITDKINDLKTIVICVSTLVLATIIAIAWFNIHDRTLMAANMDEAIKKGIDPISVRCSYVQSTDLICIAFAASAQSHNVAQQAVKK